MSEDKAWKGKRKVLTEIFNFNFLKSLAPKIAEIADAALDEMERSCSGKEIEFDVYDYTTRMTCNVIFACFFGATL